VEQAYSVLKDLWNQSKESSTGKLRPMNRRPLESTIPRPIRSIALQDKFSSINMLTDSHPSMTDITSNQARPPRLDWSPQIAPISTEFGSKGSLHRKSSSYTAPFSVPDFRELTPDLEYKKVDSEARPNSICCDRIDPPVIDKRRSWWGHRKTSSDGGEHSRPILSDEELGVSEAKNDQFKSFFAIPETERLLQCKYLALTLSLLLLYQSNYTPSRESLRFS
jgi:hypothetical protein